MQSNAIILFDGVCNLCNGVVKFIIKRDNKKYFLFTALQSKEGQELLAEYNLSPDEFNSFILIENKKVYVRSSGALRVARKLNGLWPLLYGFVIIPKFIKDAVYKWISRNRYHWFGKTDNCMISTIDLQARFLK